MIPFFIALLLTAAPPRVVCPLDGNVVGWTFKTRQTNGKTECQYQHIWMHYRGSLLVEEKHEIWMPCEVK